MGAWWRLGAEVAAWGAALVWCWRTTDLVRMLPAVVNLTGVEWDVEGAGLPSLTVVVPARNEEATIAATLDALLLADLPGLRVIAVDDRSEDRTGVILDAYAEGRPQGLKPPFSAGPMKPEAEASGYLEASGLRPKAEASGYLEASDVEDRTGVILDAYAAASERLPQGLKPPLSAGPMRPEAEVSGYLEASGVDDRTGVILDAYAAASERLPQGLKPPLSAGPMKPEAEASGYLEASGLRPKAEASGYLEATGLRPKAKALGHQEASGVDDGMRPEAEASGYLEVLHVRELPVGWLGKTYAMAKAFARCETEFVLFTDADVLFSPSVLRRAVAFAEREQADHLVVMPTMLRQSWGEGVVLSWFQLMAMWGVRLWKIADAEAKRDAIGVGAFNLVRRSALEAIGGWEPERMAIVEDLTLGRRMKAAGMRQRVAFAPGLVLVHWAKGMRGLVGVMTKNLFAAFEYRAGLMLVACVGLAAFAVLPLYGLWFRVSVMPCALLLCCVAASYRALERASGLPARYGWMYPVGAVVFAWAMVRSMVTTLWNGGVEWRGTVYPLRELREHNSPLRWG